MTKRNEREFARRDQVWKTKDAVAKWLGWVAAASGVGTFLLVLTTIWAPDNTIRWGLTTVTVFTVFFCSVCIWVAVMLDYRRNEDEDEE